MKSIEMNDEQLDFLADHDLEIFKVHNAEDCERENLVLTVNKDISSRYNYILVRMTERKENRLPNYDKCRFFTFDDIELNKGDRVRIDTCKG